MFYFFAFSFPTIKVINLLASISSLKANIMSFLVTLEILDVKVLIFRESRGWEVRYPFFTDQFKDATLTAERNLDRKIDGISGATLSVNALTKLARLALFLDSYVDNK
jgi:hypothetical protein